MEFEDLARVASAAHAERVSQPVMAAGSAFQYRTKDYDVQCDDTSDLVKVADFKKRCRELYDDIVGDHVTRSGDHVAYPKDIIEICK